MFLAVLSFCLVRAIDMNRTSEKAKCMTHIASPLTGHWRFCSAGGTSTCQSVGGNASRKMAAARALPDGNSRIGDLGRLLSTSHRARLRRRRRGKWRDIERTTNDYGERRGRYGARHVAKGNDMVHRVCCCTEIRFCPARQNG